MPAVPVIQTAPSQTFALQPVPARRSRLTPLSPGRYNVSVTLGQEGHDQLEQLQDLLRHQNPSGDLGSIITRAVRELNEREMKKRFAQVKVPRQVAREHARPGPKVNAQSKPNASKSRYVPRKVFREVYTRDDGQCTLVSPGGRRCTARGFLDVHHHGVTYARDGEATVENLRLACRAHNLFLAYQDYGRRFMQDKLLEAVRKKRAGKSFQGRVQS